MAEILGVTLGRISQMRKDGLLHAEGHPLKFDIAENVQAYVAHMVDDARGKAPTDKDAEARKLKADADYKAARARQEELKLAELEGRMHSAEDVEAATTELVYAVRSAVLALPGRVAVDAEMKPAAEVADVVRRECAAALEGLAAYEYDPKVYADMVRDRRGWQVDADDGEE
ncbi:protoporphyrinogen oxidase [Collinsella tanakaei]|uniref:hypothetical protein n=1 Tax=Collinsella tanakaei TaxID=626935 RepID=UPI00195851C3|nr:hypothetical protein [Collinsella tanakaei]MBM6756714.1 protoporphyrinogen oxidase [Collinsella tanakaei]